MGDLDEPKLKSAAKLFECVSRPSAGGPVNTDAEVNAVCKRVLSLMQEPLLPSTHPMPRSVTNGCGSPATNGPDSAYVSTCQHTSAYARGLGLQQQRTDTPDSDGGSCARNTLLQSLTDRDDRDEGGKGAIADSIGSKGKGADIGSRIASEFTNAVTGAVTGVANMFVSDSSALGRLSSDEAPPPLPASSDSDDEEPPPLTGLHFTC